MNRRTALMLSMLGGLVPQSLLGADRRTKIVQDARQELRAGVGATTSPTMQPASGDEAPAPFPPEPGFQWARYPIAQYTQRRQQPDQSPEGDHRLDLQADGPRRVARREDGGALCLTHRAPRL